MKDWKGNTNSVVKTLGASNHCEYERAKDDYFATNAICPSPLYMVKELKEQLFGDNVLTDKERLNCFICNQFTGANLCGFCHHIKRTHRINPIDYFEMIEPKQLCSCGCGQDAPIRVSHSPRYRRTKFITQHNMPGIHHDIAIRAKMANAIKKSWKTHPNRIEQRKAQSTSMSGKGNIMYGVDLHGHKNGFFGKTHSLETLVHLSAKRQGVPLEEWSGFINDFRKTMFRSNSYYKWRKAVLSRDGVCQMCGDCEKLQAHHITKVSILIIQYGITEHDDSRLWDVSNSITLCKDCHCSIYSKEHLWEDLFRRIINGSKWEKEGQ